MLYKAEAPVNSYQAVHPGLWKELSSSEKKDWEEKGEIAPQSSGLVPTEDLDVISRI